MSEPLDHVAYLSQEIGARPAGTEEERQAALYVQEQLREEAALSAEVEDFGNVQTGDLARVVCAACSIVVCVLELALPHCGTVALVVMVVAAALFAAETFGKPLLSRAFARGVSQNVVARFEPAANPEKASARRRKIVVVARYDSGKVRPEVSPMGVRVLPVLQWAELVSMILLPVLVLVYELAVEDASGSGGVVMAVLMVLAMVAPAAVAVLELMDRAGEYNEAANCNASGTAALIEVARRINLGSREPVDDEGAEAPVVHGQEAALAAGLVPEGAQLVYEASQVTGPQAAPQSPESRLASAKAAVAAFSGRPVSGVAAEDIAENLVQVQPQAESMAHMPGEPARGDEPPAAPSADGAQGQVDVAQAMAAAYAVGATAAQQTAEQVDAAGQAAPAPVPAGEAPVVLEQEVPLPADDEPAVPAWFKAAQSKARRPVDDKPVQRSRYASAPAAPEPEAPAAYEGVDLAESFRRSRAAQSPARPAAPAAPEPETPAEAAPAHEPPAPILDEADLRLDDVPGAQDVPMPSFLDQARVQEQARAQVPDEPRTSERVDVTGVPLSASGRMDPLPPRPQDDGEADEGTDEAAEPRLVELPDLGVTSGGLTPVAEASKQRAPLAEAQTSGTTAAKSLLSMLPSISLGEAQPQAEAQEGADAEGGPAPTRSALRSSLPSLSGAIRKRDGVDGSTQSVSVVGSFTAAGATGTFAPIGDELIEDVAPEDVYVYDADDSAFEGSVTETGAFAGPGYVDMPTSRVSSFFGRFRRKGKRKDDQQTPQEWLDVDESFDARTVGAERGGWESFRDEGLDEAPAVGGEEAPDEAYLPYEAYGDSPIDQGFAEEEPIDDFYSDDSPARRGRWQGGAFSLRRRDAATYEEEFGAVDEGLDVDEGLEDAGGRLAVDAYAPLADEGLEGEGVEEEIRHVHRFRNSGIETEVWFVALGAELAHNAGTNAFLDEHQQELRGAIIVDLDALGAGELCLIDNEGTYGAKKTSSRMGRLVRKATLASGVRAGSADIRWEDSASSVANKRGMQAMHLVGMEAGKPALYAQADDVMESMDEATLMDNIDFVMELLKSI